MRDRKQDAEVPNVLIRSVAYCPKNPEISKIRCVRSLANALIDPLAVGTIARFELATPSSEFRQHSRWFAPYVPPPNNLARVYRSFMPQGRVIGLLVSSLSG